MSSTDTDAPAKDQQRVAIVTGSDRGIGRAIARALAARGRNVVINHASEHSADSAAQTAQEIEQDFGVKTLVVRANVASFDEAEHLVAVTLDAFGRVDILVNNAGIVRDGLLARMKEDQFDAVIDVNLKGAFNCMRHVTKPMMKQRYGRIISMASIVGVEGNAGQVNYAASKAGIIGMGKSAAKELAGRNITVNMVAPGFIETDMTAGLSDKQREAAIARVRAGRLGRPEDVAAAVAFLASDEAAYITGQVIGVDGGLSL